MSLVRAAGEVRDRAGRTSPPRPIRVKVRATSTDRPAAVVPVQEPQPVLVREYWPFPGLREEEWI